MFGALRITSVPYDSPLNLGCCCKDYVLQTYIILFMSLQLMTLMVRICEDVLVCHY